MPPEAVPSNASVASTGKGIRYIGKDHCYAYSGAVSNAAGGSAGKTTLLDFTTGSGLIQSKIEFGVEWAGNDDVYFAISLNGLDIFNVNYKNPEGQAALTGQPFHILIPPETRFVIKWGIDNVTKDGFAMLTGRVYGAD